MSKELIIRNRENVDEIAYKRDEKQFEYNDLKILKNCENPFSRDVTEESGRYGDLKDWGFWLFRIWCQNERPDAQKFT